jgi:hypothetical protein
VRCCHYSVPAGLIGRQVRVLPRASEVIVFDGRREVARHPRAVAKGSQTLVLDHYLEVFTRKPGALPGATVLAQARANGWFTRAHDAFWAAARRTHGDAGGTRALVEVLLLHRYLPHADVVAGLEAALRAGASTPDVVAVEARKRTQQTPRRAQPAQLAWPPVQHGGAGGQPHRTTPGRSRRGDRRPALRPAAAAQRRALRRTTHLAARRQQRPAAGHRESVMTSSRTTAPRPRTTNRSSNRDAEPASMVTTSPTAGFAQRGRGLTEQAADAAIDAACRTLRLPILRDRAGEVADAANRQQLTYRGFLAELLLAECDERDRRRSERRIRAAGFPATNGCRTSTSTPTPPSTPR